MKILYVTYSLPTSDLMTNFYSEMSVSFLPQHKLPSFLREGLGVSWLSVKLLTNKNHDKNSKYYSTELEMTQLSTEISDSKEAYALELNRIKQSLKEIICSDKISNVGVIVLSEYIAFLTSQNKEEFDFSTLVEVSRLCSDEYGSYVNLARGVVYPYHTEDFTQYDTCKEKNAEKRVSTQYTQLTRVYPNPSTEMATLEFENSQSGKISIFNVDGRELLNTGFKDQRIVNLDFSKISGVSMIHINFADGSKEIIKHISIK